MRALSSKTDNWGMNGCDVSKQPSSPAKKHDYVHNATMSKIKTERGSLPLSSLRLIVPPLQLVSAAMSEIVRQGDVTHYGLLEEFVCTVLETVPELLTATESVQLVMGLRAKVVLELCRSDDFASLEAIQPHLNRLNTHISHQDKEVKGSVTNFLNLVHTLVEDHCQREIFYQKTFSKVFGPKYDSALQALLRKFLFSLQKLLPVPNLEQTSLWLSLSPSILKECVDFMNQAEPLSTLIQHHQHQGHGVPQASPSCGDDHILSSLSYHLPNVDDGGDESIQKEEENLTEINSEPMRNVERNGVQHVGGLTEDQGASVEVILPPFEESESSDDVDKKKLSRLKSRARTFKCLVCGQDFGSHSKLKKHQINQRSCFTNSASQRSFSEKKHSHPEPKTCVEDNDLNRLPDVEQPHDDYGLVCHICGKVFTYPKNFAKHQRTRCSSLAHSCNPNPMNQTEESLQGDSPSNVVPQETKPSANPPQVKSPKTCQECGQCFSYDKSFEKHRDKCSKRTTRRLKRREQQPSVCSYCKKHFSKKHYLMAHMVRHTGGFPCPVCGKKFNRKTYLKWHLYKHTGQEPYLCDICGKGWPTVAQLNVHMVQHTEARPFGCEDCGIRYKRANHLMAHRQDKHIGLRPFPCEVCCKAFRLKSLLKKHMVVHTGERPFTCSRCGKTFRRKCSLREHREKACL